MSNVKLKLTIKSDQNNGDSDVGDFIMATDLRYWWQSYYVGDFFRYVGDFSSMFIKSAISILNRSPISFTCHLHILSPTSVIDFTQNAIIVRSWVCSELLTITWFFALNSDQIYAQLKMASYAQNLSSFWFFQDQVQSMDSIPYLLRSSSRWSLQFLIVNFHEFLTKQFF